MDSAAIRASFLDYFVAHGHTVVASSSLEPRDDPTLLFTNAGMVQFKRTFLGQDPRPYSRATSCQKCVRAGGKHNDLEQVGLTRRHHTFFEMLGNFSFGDYFKRDAIRFAWEFVTSPDWLGISPDRLRVTVHHTDDDARQLWIEHSSLPPDRIYGLGDADNFWQMGDTGPCGPCSEIFVDLQWREGDKPAVIAQPDFEAQADAGRFLEIWNLVFMQFDRSADGTLAPLPKPSVDTGAGLERLTAVMEGEDDNFHTDLFRPLIARVEEVVGRKYPGGPESDGLSFRVLADHARAATFLIHDGVFPGNEGRGFVLRRIIRRAVRHAWLMGQREPTMFRLVDVVADVMGGAYPALRDKQHDITNWIRTEEARFFETIDAGLTRLDQIRASGATRIGGDEAFKLFDTYGFPLDLTQLIAGEWDIDVDVEGFDRAMTEQRERSRAVRHTPSAVASATAELAPLQSRMAIRVGGKQRFTGYSTTRTETDMLVGGQGNGRGEVILADNPFYPGGGGQVADVGSVTGEGWSLQVDNVTRDEAGRVVLHGNLTGEMHGDAVHVTAQVDEHRRRDIERNHSATHLVHMALRRALGTHVRQQGSLVEPGRLRFDFSHHGPIDPQQLADIEGEVNDLVLANADTDVREMPLQEALELGAMAFFADKYGDVVRVVRIGDSIELCGGTHVRSAGQIGLFRFTGQGGLAAGVRRIEAATGHGAYRDIRSLDERMNALAASLRAQPDQLERKVEGLLADRERLEARLAEAIKSGSGSEGEEIDAGPVRLMITPTVAEARNQLGEIADTFRQQRRKKAMLVLVNPTAPNAISVAVTDDLIAAGKDANGFVKLVTSRFGGRGGGRPTFASGTLTVDNVAAVAAAEFPALLREWLAE